MKNLEGIVGTRTISTKFLLTDKYRNQITAGLERQEMKQASQSRMQIWCGKEALTATVFNDISDDGDAPCSFTIHHGRSVFYLVYLPWF